MSKTTHQQTPTPRPGGPEPPDEADPARRLWSLWRQGQQPRVEDFLDQAGVRDPEEIVMALRVDQAERRRLGQWVSAEEYLEAFPAVRDHASAAIDLIFAEFLLREEQGERPPLEEFLRRFPEHAEELKLQIELHREMDDDPGRTATRATLAVENGAARADGPGAYPSIPGYEILGVLGRGGMGIVYRAWQAELKRPVALKMLVAGALASPAAAARFRVEIEAMARLRHANIVQIHGVGQHAGAPFLVLELVEGHSLAQFLAGTPQPAEWSARTTEALARAIHTAHRLGVVHRDLSPANILIAEDGTPKVTDFGLAKLIIGGGSLRTQTGDLLGTPSYMSPEQAAGSHQSVGEATDVYALGAILYEMLTGRPPFKAEQPLETLRQVVHEEPVTPSRLRPRLPRELETICLKCLHKEPGRRHVSALALADDLRRYLEGRPILARRSTAIERLWRWSQRSPGLAATSAMIVLLTALGVAGILWQWSAAEQARHEATQRATAEAAARRDAVQEAQKATAARDAAEQALYYNRVALADQHLAAHQTDLAEQLLDDCPPSLCQWEWHYLKRLCYAEKAPDTPRAGGPICGLAFSPDGRRLGAAAEDGAAIVMDGTTGQWLFWRFGHSGPVRSVAFRPDGRVLASGGGQPDVRASAANPQSGETILWDATSGRELCRMVRSAQVTCVAFAPDGRLVAAGGLDGSVVLYEAATGGAIRTLNCFEVHQPPRRVAAVAFSPDGQCLASASWDGAIRVWNVATGRNVQTLRHRWSARCVAFSPDGRRLATAGGELVGSFEGELKLWDLATGSEVFGLRGHVGVVLCVAFSPDGRRLASAGVDRRIRVWDTGAGQPILALSGHEHEIRAIVFSPDGRRLAAGSADHSVRIYDASPARTKTMTAPRVSLRGHRQSIRHLAFSSDGRHLASAGADQQVRLWDTLTGRERLVGREQLDSINALALSPDGTRIATGGDDRVIRLWDAATGKPTRDLRGHTSSIMGLAFSPDGRRLASACQDEPVSIWDPDSGHRERVLRGHLDWVMAVAFSPDGRHLASGDDDVIRLWDDTTGQELRRLRGHSQRVDAVAFSPDGRRLASTSHDGRVLLWDPATGEQIRTFDGVGGLGPAFSPDGRLLAASAGGRVRVWDLATGWRVLTLGEGAVEICCLAFGADGRLATGGSDGTIGLWDTDTAGEALSFGESRRLAGHPAPVWDLAVDGEGRVASGGDDATVRVWNPSSGAQIRRLDGHQTLIVSVAVTRDGRRAISGGWDGTLCRWDLESGTLIRRFAAQPDVLTALAISPDGRHALSGGGGRFEQGQWKTGTDLAVRLWDLESGACIRRLEGHTGNISSVAFSPDGHRGLSASWDRTARIWDLSNGRELCRFTGHGDPVNCGAFLPDGARVLSGGGDHRLRLWDAATGRELPYFDAQASDIFWLAVSPDGHHALSSSLAARTVRLWDLAGGRELACFQYEGVLPTRGAFLPDGRHAVWASTDGVLRVWDLPIRGR